MRPLHPLCGVNLPFLFSLLLYACGKGHVGSNPGDCPAPTQGPPLALHYSVEELGKWPGTNGYNSIVEGVSPDSTSLAAGQIQEFTDQGVAITAVTFEADGSITSVASGGVATGANRSGQVVGAIFSGQSSQAFLFTDHSITDLPGLGGSSTATAINADGVVVGWSETTDGYAHAFVFRDGAFTDLGTFSGILSYAKGINQAGVVAGYYIATDYAYRAFAYHIHSLNFLDLGGLGGRLNVVNAINDSCVAAGYSALTAGSVAPYHAVRYRAGQVEDLGALGDDLSAATSINASGQVAGSYTLYQADHAFLYGNFAGDADGAPERMVDFQSLVQGSDWIIFSKVWFGPNGTLIGNGINAQGSNRAFIARSL